MNTWVGKLKFASCEIESLWSSLQELKNSCRTILYHCGLCKICSLGLASASSLYLGMVGIEIDIHIAYTKIF